MTAERYVCEFHGRECYTKSDAARAAVRLTRQKRGQVLYERCLMADRLPRTAGIYHLVGAAA